MKLKCAELGRRFDADFARDIRGSGGFPLASRFAYNAKLNTCIARVGAISKPISKGLSHRFIVDLATNEELANDIADPSDADIADPSDADASRAEKRKFDQREFELFGPKPD